LLIFVKNAQKVQAELSGFSEEDLVSEQEIEEQQLEVNRLEEKYSEVQVRLQACNNRIEAIQERVNKIEDVKKNFRLMI